MKDHENRSCLLLYIEDDLPSIKLIERVLAHRPEIKLLPTMQGQLGLNLAREHSPDLILLDMHLPDIQGPEVLQQLRTDPKTRQIPVIVISADDTLAQMKQALSAGATDYLVKPLDVKQFLQVVDQILKD